MDAFLHRFSVSGVETYVFLPPLVMFLISSLTSMGGISGAFILLPFQMSVLGYTTPGVSATNLVYNVVAIPVGVYRHIREGRLAWPLFAVLIAGALPGMVLGYYIRVRYLPDPQHFRLFVGLVLLYMGVRTLQSALADLWPRTPKNAAEPRLTSGRITKGRLSLFRVTIDFQGQTYVVRTAPLFLVSLIVGVVGGAYGIGGGAVLAPFCISVLNLPVYVVSGAVLSSAWVSSIAAALCYAFIPVRGTVNAPPDWLLGALFGLGGMAGIYFGTRLQKHVPTMAIKLVVGLAILFIAVRYTSPAVRALLS